MCTYVYALISGLKAPAFQMGDRRVMPEVAKRKEELPFRDRTAKKNCPAKTFPFQ